MHKITPDLQPLAQPIDSVTPLPGNPNQGHVEGVRASLRRFGQRKAVTVRAADRVITAGNTTWLAAKAEGWDQVAVVVVDEAEAEAKAWALTDNRTRDQASYVEENLAAMIAEVKAADEALLADTGWDRRSVEDLLRSIDTPPPEIRGDPDAVPARPKRAVTRPGDVWQLGPHRVRCGDSRVVADVVDLLDGDRADAVWEDPPYGIEYEGGTDEKLTIDGDDEAGLEDLLARSLDAMLAVTKPGAPVYVAAPPGPQSVDFAVALKVRGLYRQRLAWVKDSLVLGRSDYHYRHEDLYYGFVPGAKGRRVRGSRDGAWYGDNAQTTVLAFPRPKRNKEHPTMKPVALVQHCLSNSTAADDLVLDLFGGSGTTLIACHALGRRARLQESDPRYVDVICRRYQEATGQQPVLRSTGVAHDFAPGA